jgi:hypothetical protein
MKSLTPSLAAAQRSASSRPYVRARFSDFQGDRPRLRPVRHYTGGEASSDHAVLVTAAGTLLRARTQAGPEIRVNRVVNPGPGSNFASDSQVASNVMLGGGIALTQATDGVIWLVYTAANTTDTMFRTSNDDGASWSAEGTANLGGGAQFNLVAAAGPTATIMIAVSANVDQVYTWRWQPGSGTFSAPALWPHSGAVASVTGLAMTFQDDWQLVITGTAETTANPNVWTAIVGAGVDLTLDTWSALSVLQPAIAGSGITYDSPFVSQVSAFWRVTYVEIFAGPVAYNRVFWCSMDAENNFLQSLWSEPMPFDYAAANVAGLSVAASPATASAPARLWLSRPDGVWSSASPANPELDVSAGVLEASVDVDERGARVRLVLDNSEKAPGMPWPGGWFSTGVLRRGARLQLTPGYRTGAGEEAPLPYSYWVESIEVITGQDDRRVVVHARDAWWLLESWEARRSFTWALGERTLSQLMLFILARAALSTSTAAPSSFFTSHQPAFAIHPGQSGKAAVERLLAMVEDVAFFNGANLVVGVAGLGDPVDYAIGGKGSHTVLRIRFWDTPPEASQTRVQGLGTFDAAYDFGEIETHGERIAQAFNINLDAGAEATAVAAALLRKAQLAARADEVDIFGVHCGVELFDVVALTHPQEFGPFAANRRVRGYSWKYETFKRGRYDMRLVLGVV